MSRATKPLGLMTAYDSLSPVILPPGIDPILYAPIDLKLILLVQTVVKLLYEHDGLICLVLLELLES